MRKSAIITVGEDQRLRQFLKARRYTYTGQISRKIPSARKKSLGDGIPAIREH
ncbi:uncharacterized protein SPAPADRAFT_61818 [Spathaspora passalidarum NRRL Y-27907]|uniref:Uncharacterized protein n=1 Tax=Spathaspora passalidarum (strain NRRL Y-27907 / 11-Y1) TaxID=619300 RepID=G3AR70_SPAPN|nr:uncharacterized protein SPAPADRAFT_61818 [Spathaspora passalidarum NRRL Y-27907]EGW31245.1 hypothetical protein SPAPADRAFT_61818 [Spathaspora passalidarum NRRL Y-27907]